MTFDEGLKQELKKIKGLKVYPIVAPEGIKSPFLVYRRSRSKYTKDLSGITNQCEAVYELILICDGYSEISNQCENIKETLMNTLFKNIGGNGPYIDDLELEFNGEEYIYQPNAFKSSILLTVNYKEE